MFAHFCLGAGFRMDLKLSEGIIRTTYYRLISKNPKNLDFDFQRKIQKFLGYSMAEKTGRNGDGERRSNFGIKLNVHVQYNMLTATWPSPIAKLT